MLYMCNKYNTLSCLPLKSNMLLLFIIYIFYIFCVFCMTECNVYLANERLVGFVFCLGLQ